MDSAGKNRFAHASIGLTAVVLLACCGCTGQPSKGPIVSPTAGTEPAPAEAPAPAPSQPDVSPQQFADLAAFNRGAALMEQYRYSDAAKEFRQVIQNEPHWAAARFNLGLAYLNMQGSEGAQDHLDMAKEEFSKLLEANPDDAYAHYCLGMLYEHLGEAEKAAAEYKAVAKIDPDDPHVLYKYGQALVEAGQTDEGTAVLAKAVEVDPGFISAVYRLALLYQRNRQVEEAKKLFERFKALKLAEMTGGSFAVRKVYGSAGKYYHAMGADHLPLPSPEPREGIRVVFSPETRTLDVALQPWRTEGGTAAAPAATAGDVDNDGDLDLCLSGMADNGVCGLWLNDGKGNFARGADLADQVTSPNLGDVDNDGDLDLWLGRAGAPLLLQNDGTGVYEPVTYTDQSLDPPGLTSCARLVDVDSDADLDCLAFRSTGGNLPVDGKTKPAPSLVYNNNRDGSYEEIAEKLGLQFADTAIGTVVHDDFDNDRDLDMIAFPAGKEKPIVWLNDRVWEYHRLDAEAAGLNVQQVVGATSADVNKDGRQDLLVFCDEQLHLFLNESRLSFVRDESFENRFGKLGGTNGQAVDIDNDGDLDLLIADAHRGGTRGPVLLLNDRGAGKFDNAAQLDPGIVLDAVETPGDAACLVADFTSSGVCDLLLLPVGGKPVLLENLTAGNHWLAIDLRGVQRQDNKGRSNNSAIGARVEVKTGSILQQFTVGVPTGAGVVPPLRIHAGLGPFEKVDWLRVYWPDAVLQAELELAANQVMTLEELPRKTSSCPTLFTWDGTHYRFVADFAGVGGLGFFLAPGQYAPPDPTEYLPIPVLEPQNGEYVLQVLEPLEETVYFDEAKLLAVDHPADTEVWPYEMMPVSSPPPPFELFCTRDKIEAVRAIDHEGTDVTSRLAAVDRQYAGTTRVHPEFLGFAEPHFVELDFGDQLANLSKDARLVMYFFGWVEYGYSSTNFAAYQAGMAFRAPTIQVLREGKWVDVLSEVGYPAGLEHVMTLDVTGAILPGDQKVRVTSNMELYWDRIYLGVAEDLPLQIQEVPVASAELSFFGYPREYTPDGKMPNVYDYHNVDRAMGWKLMEGDFTRFGEVGELLSEPDDCYVIMGRGERLTLRFPVEAFEPVPEGYRRTFLLKSDAYCKDLDLYTAFPDTLEPLPFHGMSAYPYGPNESYPDTEKTRAYRAKYNTRKVRNELPTSSK